MPSEALTAEIAEVEGTRPKFTMFGQEWTVVKTPPTFMLSKLGTIESGDPDSFGVVYQFAKIALGDQIHRFEAAWFEAAPTDGDDSSLIAGLIEGITEAAYGRPTESSQQ